MAKTTCRSSCTSKRVSVAFDIETIPDESAPIDEPTAPSNYKDEDKIAAYIADAKRKQRKKLALSPWTGRVCAFGYQGDGYADAYVINDVSDKAERNLITQAMQILAETHQLVTWNGIAFDIPYLYTRAMLLKVKRPVGLNLYADMTRRYQSIPHLDLMQHLAGWNVQNVVSLDMASRIALGAGKADRDYEEYLDAITDGFAEAIRMDVLEDVGMTWALFERVREWML